MGNYAGYGYTIRRDNIIMKHAKSICRVVGCGALISLPGYCDIHKDKERGRFKELHKAPGSRAFYSKSKWTKTARAFRVRNPLCASHQRRELIVKGNLVHHTIEVPELIARGLDPYGFEYLETLCYDCHNRELRARKHIHRGIHGGACGVGGIRS